MNVIKINEPRRNRGTVATELAIVVPMLFTIALGCCDFGRIMHFKQVVGNASRTGAELGALQGFTEHTYDSWVNSIQSGILEEMSNIPSYDESSVNIELSTTVDGDGLPLLTVGVTYPFTTIVSWPFLPTEVPVFHETTFRRFR